MLWTILVQGARELHDDGLLDVASRARDQSRRQLAWLRTTVEHEAPDAIAIVPDRSGQLAASLPKRPTSIASIPDPVWGPVSAALVVLVVGLLGLLVGLPWLVPSIGPSAVLIAVTPNHPTARAWNTIVGHAGGILAGFAAVAVLGANSALWSICQASAPAIVVTQISSAGSISRVNVGDEGPAAARGVDADLR